MSDELISIVQNELDKDELTEIRLDKLLKLVDSLRKLRRRYSDEIHDIEIKSFEELIESLFELRIEKVLEGSKLNDSFDKQFLSILNTMRVIYISFLSGKYYIFNDKILCKVVSPFMRKGVLLSPGDIVLLPIHEVLALITSGYITPIEVV
ncbi:hypothetical protein DDW09_01430 [Sulfolobus sp. SCGC AB-777_L09]|jgi:hypothetical protein|nr:hypothetical protein [Stygiolobus sp.]MDT7876349.1 hypothetical protein [Sulfolobaceae archaeon]PVU70785.1 hypothetical protein DDW09_01430 [Sulfolobus sp. SCGC AB-777_L09]